MYSVTEDYITSAKLYSGLRYVIISDGIETITEDDDMIDLKIEAKGGIGQVVIKKATIRHGSTYNFLDKIVNIKAGIGLDNTYSALGKTGNYTAVLGDDLSHITFTGAGPFTLSLDDVATLGDGYKLKVTNGTGLDLVINPDGAEEIDGQSTFFLGVGTTVYLKCNGTGWDTKYTDFQVPTYVDYGDFTVHKAEYDKETNETVLDAYDALYESLKDSTLEEVAGTATVDDLLGLICSAIGVTKASGTYPNYDTIIGSDPYFGVVGTKFRTILEHIAEVAGGVIRLNASGELEVVSLQVAPIDAITLAEQNTLRIESKWGGVNSVVLSRSPQEDNVAQVDQPDIDANGLWEVRFENNTLADADRNGYIPAIFTELSGYEFYPFETETTGLGYLQVGDRITVQDLDEATYATTIFECNLHFSGGLVETLKADIPNKSKTPYKYIGLVNQTIGKTEIRVDKQQQQIDLLAESVATAVIPRQAEPPADPVEGQKYIDSDDNIMYVWTGTEWVPTSISASSLDNYYTKDETYSLVTLTDEEIISQVADTTTIINTRLDDNEDDVALLESQMATVTQTASDLSVAIEKTGGRNLVINSSGIKGNQDDAVEEWQLFDSAGDLIDVNNVVTSEKSAHSVASSTEAKCALKIGIGKNAIQAIPTLIGVEYTFYCRHYSETGGSLLLNITGVADAVETVVNNDEWEIHKTTFIATSPNTVVKMTAVDAISYVADIVVKAGDVLFWEQAPNEMYGQNFRFDKSGFSVTNPNNSFRSTLDEDSLAMYDVDIEKAYFSKDEVRMRDVTIKNDFKIQQIDTASKGLRIIPNATGVFIIIDD